MKRLVKRIISKDNVAKLKKTLDRFDDAIVPFFAKSGFLSSIYYTFFSRQFDREHKSVLQGRIHYEQSLRDIGESCVLLRRNVHRLEKGLIMRPRRAVFAENYILETIACFENVLKAGSLCPDEKKWATDVLSEYFVAVSDTDIIKGCRERFVNLSQNNEAPTSVPYAHQDLPQSDITYDSLLTLFKRRRSVRWFQDKSVAVDDIRKAVNAATFAPTACNRQPFEFHVVNGNTKASEIANCAMGTVGFANNLPCIIAIVGKLDAYPSERDRHIIYIDGALASMQLMLALETLGLSTCSINWPDIEEREVLLSKKLDLAYHERVVMLLAVGYAEPEGGIPFSQKKTDKLLVKEVK